MLKRSALPVIVLGLIVLPALFGLYSPREAAPPDPPKLVVLLYFDQLRGDYLTRWDNLFGEGGFHRLEHDGAWFQNCHYPYANTITGAGHASVVTGCSPDKHGIIANEWYDRDSRMVVNCVESERHEHVPPPPKDAPKEPASSTARKKYTGVAPNRLLSPTVADVLKEAHGKRGRIVSLSMKDRGAVLPGGKSPDACYWFDADSGQFVTSQWYHDRLHPWVAKFNEGRPADQWFGKEWTRLRSDLDYEKYSGKDDVKGEGKGTYQGVEFPHPFPGIPLKLGRDYYSALYNSPQGNELLLALAKQAIDAEKLGTHDVPDLLCLSFSSNDPIGHTWGPDSQEVLDVTLRSDLIVKELLATLDEKVGKGRYVLVLTADHGVCPLPDVSRSKGKDAGRIPATMLRKANDYLVKQFGGDETTRYIEEAVPPWLYLNQTLLKKNGLKTNEVAESLAEWLKKQDGVQTAYTNEQLQRGVAEDDVFGQMVRRSFQADRCGDVGLVPKPYWIVYGMTGTTHGSPHLYDTHVPLLVYGPGIKSGVRKDLVRPQAAAVILARALGIKPPADATESVPKRLFAE